MEFALLTHPPQDSIVTRRLQIASLACLMVLSCLSSARTQDNAAASTTSDHELSSGQWRARVDASRKASENFVARALTRSHDDFNDDFNPDKELARMSEERVLNDDSLRRGDIISTRKGLFVFKGDDPERARQPEDFVPLGSDRK